MKKRMLISVMIICAVAYSDTDSDIRSAIRNGAVGRYTYRVVDDEGVAVSNAQAHVWFRSYGRPQDKADWVVETDTNGMFTVEHRFNEKFSVDISKEGYYRSYDEINYLMMQQLPVKDGKWQPYGERRGIVLRRIRNPIQLRGARYGYQRSYPENDQWTGFDLEQYDWCPPCGRGCYADMLIRFRKEQTSSGYVKTMDVCFTNNPFAGVYLLDRRQSSALKTVYRADTNALYKASISYNIIKSSSGISQNTLNSDQYLVFRTRTKIDVEGRVVRAHYGVIGGDWRFLEKGGMTIRQVLFNSIPNDPNIEDVQVMKEMNDGVLR